MRTMSWLAWGLALTLLGCSQHGGRTNGLELSPSASGLVVVDAPVARTSLIAASRTDEDPASSRGYVVNTVTLVDENGVSRALDTMYLDPERWVFLHALPAGTYRLRRLELGFGEDRQVGASLPVGSVGDAQLSVGVEKAVGGGNVTLNGPGRSLEADGDGAEFEFIVAPGRVSYVGRVSVARDAPRVKPDDPFGIGVDPEIEINTLQNVLRHFQTKRSLRAQHWVPALTHRLEELGASWTGF